MTDIELILTNSVNNKIYVTFSQIISTKGFVEMLHIQFKQWKCWMEIVE